MNMKWLRFAVVVGLLGTLTVQADPIKTWHWSDPVFYVNGQPIPANDLSNRTLHCSNNSGEPYEVSKLLTNQVSPSAEDMAFIAQGLEGTYYCVQTVYSISQSQTSGYSNEANFTVTSADLGFVPNPPTNLSIQ